MTQFVPAPLQFTPSIRNYVWGGRSMLALAGPEAAQSEAPIAEVWAIYENNLVCGGPFAGRSLADLAAAYPKEMLGAAQTSGRFPILVKLLDCARWLSLQVHPNDEQALALEGAGFMGKTEAWHILAAQPQSQLIAGIKPKTAPKVLAQAMGQEALLDLVEYHTVQKGDTVFMPAGTIHALGPGLLVYEVQQTSDLTYRVFDWNRPQTAGRELHVEKSQAVTNPLAQGQISSLAGLATAAAVELIQCPYFRLELLTGPQARDTRAESFHALTVLSGTAQLTSADSTLTLNQFESALVPAAAGPYQLAGQFQMLCSSVGK